ncbi:MAG: hypothetical protein HUU54_10355 [Ignavibacteriaceae bacterium]|nr:hypothetical protein [Ignavibacteriaceae bacterium]
MEIEREFERINQLLRISPASRYKLKLISDFLLQINNFRNKNFLRSYYILLHPHFTQLIKETDFSFTNPAFIRELIHFTDLLEGIVENPTERSELIISRERLVLVLHQIIDTAQLRFTHVPAPEKSELHNSVNIPLLENELLSASGHSNFSSVRKLFVELSYSKSSNGDIVQLTNHLGTEQQKIFEKAIRAARTVVTKITGSCPTKKMVAMCWFERPDYLLGESLLAGLAVSIAVGMIKMMQNRREYSIRTGIAITGGIDPDGRMLSVDDTGLLKKLEACFFSPIKILVVPEEQYHIAKRHQQAFKESYPEIPELKLVPVNNIKDILLNPELTEIKPIRYPVWALRKIWKIRRVIALLLFLILAGTLSLVLYGPVDKNPVKHTYKGDYLVIQNQFGEALDYIKLSSIGIDYLKRSRDYFNYVDFIDIDDDGINEVIYCDRKINTYLDIILCKSITQNKILWKHELKKKIKFVGVELLEDSYICGSLYVLKNPDSKYELLVLARCPYFSTYLTKIDARDGKELQCYVHIGGLNLIKFIDLDYDGRTEVVIGGINNAFKSAVLIVFDQKLINGQSPGTTKYRVQDLAGGTEKYYIKFPNYLLGQVLVDQLLYGNLHEMDIFSEAQYLRLHIKESFSDNTFDVSYYVYLNFNMNPKSLATSTPYENKIALLKKTDQIYGINRQRLNTEYLNSIEYWTGDKFVKSSSLNSVNN